MPSKQTAFDPDDRKTRMPTFFIPHGAGPCFFMEWNPPTVWQKMGEFLATLADSLPQRPRAIVLISAHWLDSTFSVTSGAQPELIYDYYGFPPDTYELRYPAPGEPQLAARIVELLNQAQLPAQSNPHRDFDHGMFIPLKLMFPNADIPVVQLSLHNGLTPQTHLQAGRALASLRDKDVLVIGSGMSFHNMRGYGDPRFGPISDEFDQWLRTTIESAPQQRNQFLLGWAQAPAARLCHPPGAEEHLLPLMVVAGAATDDIGQCIFSDRVLETTLSAFRFG